MFAAYRRVSRVGSRDERLRSPEQQAEQILAAASREDVKVEMLPPELDVSGSKESRVILDSAIARIEAGELEGLIVARFDRLSRMSPVKRWRVLERIEKAGGTVISYAEPLDATTPEGRFVRETFFNVAQMELERKAEGFDESKRGAIAAGYWTAPKIPLGYLCQRSIQVDGKTKKVPAPLTVDPATAPLVKRCFEKRAAGESWWGISAYMTKAVGKTLDQRRIQHIIRNPCYLGESRQGEYLNPTAHPALVDRTLWEAAQRSVPRPPRSAKAPALLSGLGRCGTCGSRMTSHGGARASYICSRHQHCPAPAQIVAHRVEPIVEERVLRALEGLTAEARLRSADLDAALSALAHAEGLLADYNSPEVQEGMSRTTWLAGIRAREERVEAAAKRVRQARSASPVLPDPAELAAHWPELTVQERRHVLAGAVGAVYVAAGHAPPEDRVSVLAASFDPGPIPLPSDAEGVLA